MKRLLKEYYRMNKKEKKELKDLYIWNELQKQVNNCKELKLDILEEQNIFKVTKNCLKYCNISCEEIIKRLLEMLKCVDITIDDVTKLNMDELIELLSKEKNDFKDIKCGPEIVTAFLYGNFYCVLLKENEEYLLIYEKNDGTQYIDKFINLQAILKYVIKNKLLSIGEDVV